MLCLRNVLIRLFCSARSLSLVALMFLVACTDKGGEPEIPYTSDVCFIGDSITDYWDLEEYFPDYDIHKHARAGALVQDMDEWDVSDCEGIPTVFLMGTNNITAENYGEVEDLLVEDLSEVILTRAKKIKASPFLLVSILPRNGNGVEHPIIYKLVTDQNKWIYNKLKSSGIYFKYIDVYSDFLNDEGTINESLFKDGLHPNDAGYEVLAAKIKTFLPQKK